MAAGALAVATFCCIMADAEHACAPHVCMHDLSTWRTGITGHANEYLGKCLPAFVMRLLKPDMRPAQLGYAARTERRRRRLVPAMGGSTAVRRGSAANVASDSCQTKPARSVPMWLRFETTLTVVNPAADEQSALEGQEKRSMNWRTKR